LSDVSMLMSSSPHTHTRDADSFSRDEENASLGLGLGLRREGKTRHQRHESGVRFSEVSQERDFERGEDSFSSNSPVRTNSDGGLGGPSELNDASFDDRESVASRDGIGAMSSSAKSITSQSDLEAMLKEGGGAFCNMHGYLMKRTQDGFSGWQPRYFHLSDSGVLSCYVSKNDYDNRANVEGQISVRDIDASSLEKLKEGTDGSCSFTFEVQGTQFELESPSPANASEWACCIHTLAKLPIDPDASS